MPATQLYHLSLHDALPISWIYDRVLAAWGAALADTDPPSDAPSGAPSPTAAVELRVRALRQLRTSPSPSAGDQRSEEHTSELQSHVKLVCRLLLEKKKTVA